MEAEEEQPFPGLGLGRPTPDEAAPRAARLRLRPHLRLPQARLANPAGMNLCYANSSLQAWSWLRELADSPESLQGSAQASAHILHAAQTVLLTDCLALHPVFRTWPELSRQHDVGEFWQHLVASWRLDAFAGRWQACTDFPFRIVDQGSLDCPITLHLHGHTLQGLISNWRNQASVYGIAASSGAICFQLCRFQRDGAKDMKPIAIPPGLRVSLPHFNAPTESIEVASQDYRVGFVIYHQGPTILCGHYQAALSYPDTAQDPVTWQYMICNDKKAPRPASSRDLKLIERNSYLVGLLRS